MLCSDKRLCTSVLATSSGWSHACQWMKRQAIEAHASPGSGNDSHQPCYQLISQHHLLNCLFVLRNVDSFASAGTSGTRTVGPLTSTALSPPVHLRAHHSTMCATQLRHQLDGVIAGQILELEISEATAVRHVLVYAGDASIGHRI